MKRLIICFLILLSLASSAVYSQNSAVLHLRGMIAPNVNVSTNIPETNIIDLRTAKDFLLGTISLNSNQAGGYLITIASKNLGMMKNNASESTLLPYTISFGGSTDINLATEYQALLSSPSGSNNVQLPVQVNFPGAANPEEQFAAGVYEDVIVITVSIL